MPELLQKKKFRDVDLHDSFFAPLNNIELLTRQMHSDRKKCRSFVALLFLCRLFPALTSKMQIRRFINHSKKAIQLVLNEKRHRCRQVFDLERIQSQKKIVSEDLTLWTLWIST
jgi:hypothetical protein